MVIVVAVLVGMVVGMVRVVVCDGLMLHVCVCVLGCNSDIGHVDVACCVLGV